MYITNPCTTQLLSRSRPKSMSLAVFTMKVSLLLVVVFLSFVSSSPLTDANKFGRIHNAFKLDHISNSSSSNHVDTNTTYGHEWDCKHRVIGYGENGKQLSNTYLRNGFLDG